MLAITTLLSLVLTAAQETRPPARESITVELTGTAPALAGHGTARTFTHTPAHAGTLYVRARDAEARLVVRIETPAGRLVCEDDGDSGERAVCAIVSNIEPLSPLIVTVAVAEPGESTGLELDFMLAPETAATRAAAGAAFDAVERSAAKHSAGDRAAAREILEAALAELSAVQGHDRSRVVAEANWRIGRAAHTQKEMSTAVAALSRAHAFQTHVLPADHDRLLILKGWLADAKYRTADPHGSHDLLEEVLAVWIRRLPRDDENLRRAKGNLGVLRYYLGDLEGARALQEEVLSTLAGLDHPEDHEVLVYQGSLARTRFRLGDVEGARMLQETIVAAREELADPDDFELLRAKVDLAQTLILLGDLDRGRELQEEVNAAWTRVLEPGNHTLLTLKWSLATTRSQCGDADGARSLRDQVLSTHARSQSSWDPKLAGWIVDLARTKYLQADLEGALELLEEALEIWTSQRGPRDPAVLSVRSFIALTRSRLGDVDGASALVAELLPDVRTKVGQLCLESPRAAREIASLFLDMLSVALFISESHESPSPLAPSILETLASIRHASIAGPGVALAIGARPDLAAGQRRVAELKRGINDLAASGPSAGQTVEAWRSKLFELTTERDRLQRELRRALGESGATAASIEVASIAGALAPDAVAISYLRFPRRLPRDPETGLINEVDTLVAFLVRPGGGVEIVPLGPAQPLEDSISAWRAAIGKPIDGSSAEDPAAEDPGSTAFELGVQIREGILDPILTRAGQARTVHVVPDDFLYLLPFDALPLGSGVVGDRYELRIDPSLARLNRPPVVSAAPPSLLLVGGVDYDAELPSGPPPSSAAATPPTLEASADTRAGTPDSGFRFLSGSAEEIRSIGRLFEGGEGHEPRRLTGAGATKAALHASVPGARYLHIATHGWFAPEVFRSRLDRAELSAGHRRQIVRATETVRGFAPATLCGLALSGANRGRAAIGRVPGLLTAEELTTLDLRDCDLAVLSACDTNVGMRRAGQGVRSLQSALHAAGARSAITSLWKVDDGATQELMVELYGNLWRKRLGKAEALWAAKSSMRERGYPESAWAGWVLSGDPH